MNYKDLENNLHFLDSTEFEHLLPVGCVQITDDEADSISKVAEQARLDAMTYAENRQAAYPPIVDQLDTIFHGGLDAWKAEIQAVKTQFPKEAS
jgi:hypothetical protein